MSDELEFCDGNGIEIMRYTLTQRVRLRDIAGVRPAVRLCGVDGRASGVYLKRQDGSETTSVTYTFSQISVSYATAVRLQKLHHVLLLTLVP